MFTDIKSSTQYWDTKGDIRGRMMIDYHNRLIFPIIKKFRGKVIKTIGDAFMISFKKPVNAVMAAITIQQILKKERRKDKKIPQVCIGIHSGRAIIEKGDIFGDMINVASRIEKKAKGNEILMSAKIAAKISLKKYCLAKKERFTPKGKKRAITVYKCRWQKVKELIEDVNFRTSIFLKPLQKWELLAAGIVTVAGLIFFYLKYIRYLLTDYEMFYLILLNPKDIILIYPITAVIPVLILFLLIYLFLKIKRISLGICKLLNGGLGYFILFFLFYLITVVLPLNIGMSSEKLLFRSKHLFVEIMTDKTSIFQEPATQSTVLRKVRKGTLLLQSDVQNQGELIWNKVLLGRDEFGWVLRIDPPRIGVPERRISLSRPFEFKYLDVYNLFFGVIGFFLGFFRFKIRPV